MASLNRVQLIGNLGRDPELRHTNQGDPVTTLSVATTERWKDRESGELKEATEWHRVVVFGRAAEACAACLVVGAQIFAEGSLHTRRWTDRDEIERFSTEIRAGEVKFLGTARRAEFPAAAAEAAPEQEGGVESPAEPATPRRTRKAVASVEAGVDVPF